MLICSCEHGFGIADTFPALMFGTVNHHALSHSVAKGKQAGGSWENWSRYDHSIANQVADFVDRLSRIEDPDGPVLRWYRQPVTKKWDHSN